MILLTQALGSTDHALCSVRLGKEEYLEKKIQSTEAEGEPGPEDYSPIFIADFDSALLLTGTQSLSPSFNK